VGCSYEFDPVNNILRYSWDGNLSDESLLKGDAAGRRLLAARPSCRGIQSFRITPFMVRVPTRCRLRDAALVYQQPLHNLRMVTPRAESSPSNCATAGEVSRSPGTMTAHSRFSRSSFDVICHSPKDDDIASPIWTMDQCRTNPNAPASSGIGPERMKWLFPCTRMPTMCSQASRRGSATG
jgi:hypothetical protein